MRKVLLLFCLGLVLVPVSVFAADSGLAQRVTALEDRLSQGWFEKVQLSGALEAEANYTDEDGEKSDDVDLATVELGVDVTLTDFISGFVLFKWEGDEDGVFVDEGGITLGNVDEGGYAVTVGKLYVPFGVFETVMLADPLTLELGETREGAAVVDFAAQGFYGSAYAFNSELDKDGDDDKVDAFGLMAGYAMESDAYTLDVSAGYISNITSSGGFIDGLDAQGSTIAGQTAGMTVAAVVGVGDFTLVGEYLAALDSDYSAATTEEPSAWYVEVVYGFDLAGYKATLAATYQESEEADYVGLAETRYGAALGVELTEGLGMTFEYLRDEGYDNAETDSLTAQLAFEF
ncbi:MAG: LbtU family siderophore porin [Desulfuromonadales bacterium]|nr:LbtU family siderophore porin [Desulfuromonadales bacterium]MBN2791377.1 LbtU family siderophore porin [Desulfuromonadales bacterium]